MDYQPPLRESPRTSSVVRDGARLEVNVVAATASLFGVAPKQNRDVRAGHGYSEPVIDRQRAAEVEQFLASLPAWARERGEVRAVALVGSWSYGRPHPDSDVDVVLLIDAPDTYIDGDHWLSGLGGVRLINTQRWGVITERRFALPSGLEVELGIGKPDWASTSPVDDGTRRVVTDGIRAIYDPDRLLAKLQARLLG
jgi:hypothetical protein